MNVLLSLNFIAFLGVTVYAVYLFVYLIRTRISYIRLGQKEDFDKRTKERLQKIWENVFGQKKLLKDKKAASSMSCFFTALFSFSSERSILF